MPAPKRLPPNSELERLVREGYTHQQIVDWWLAKSGEQVSRSSVSAALSRAGLTAQQHRFKDELPWRVKAEHIKQYPARMLRLLGRQRAGVELTEDEQARLDGWLEALEDKQIVVAYAPDGDGFIYVDADEKGDCPNGIPIRPRTVQPDELPDFDERP